MCIIHQDFMKENNDTQDRQKIRCRKNPDRSTQKSSPLPHPDRKSKCKAEKEGPTKNF